MVAMNAYLAVLSENHETSLSVCFSPSMLLESSRLVHYLLRQEKGTQTQTFGSEYLPGGVDILGGCPTSLRKKGLCSMLVP